MVKRPIRRGAMALVAACAIAPANLSFDAAHAHAALHHASPAAGSTVSAAPQEIALSFTETLEAAFSSVEVTNSGGSRVDEGRAEVSGSTMRVGLKALSPGSYRVHWRAVSSDTHKAEGHYTFTVSGQ